MAENTEFEFFKKQFEFTGRHARMVSEMWCLNDYHNTYFKRLIDLYILAAVVGFRVDRKAGPDYSPIEGRKIFPEQMIHAKEDLDYIMQIMIMLDRRRDISDEEAVKEAFRGAQTKEEFDRLQDMFNSYVRGGVEELYERLIVRRSDSEDEYYDKKTANLMAMYEMFAKLHS